MHPPPLPLPSSSSSNKNYYYYYYYYHHHHHHHHHHHTTPPPPPPPHVAYVNIYNTVCVYIYVHTNILTLLLSHIPISLSLYPPVITKPNRGLLWLGGNRLWAGDKRRAECRPGGWGVDGALHLFFGRGVRPGPRHPNPGLNQKFANVYRPGVNQISVSIHYIYVAPNYIWIIFSAYKVSIIISKDSINNK